MTDILNPTDVYAISGDWHGSTRFAVAAIDYAFSHGAQTIIHLGDFGFDFTDHFMHTITDTLALHDMDLYFIDGNHENFDKLYSYPLDEHGLRPMTERITHIPRGFRWTWGTKTYMGFGGAASVDRLSRIKGYTWWPQEQITAGDYYRASEGGPVDVLFTHDAPTNAWCRRDPENDTSWIPRSEIYQSDVSAGFIQELVETVKPKVLYHGHFHRRYEDEIGIPGTTVIGLGCNGSVDKDTIRRNTVVRITS